MASGCVSTPIRWEQANFLSSSLPVKGIKHRLRMMIRNTNLNEDMMVTGHGFEPRSEGHLAIEGHLQLLKYWPVTIATIKSSFKFVFPQSTSSFKGRFEWITVQFYVSLPL